MPDTFDKLPNELLLEILYLLDTVDVLVARFVCKTFHVLTQPILQARQAEEDDDKSGFWRERTYRTSFRHAVIESHLRYERSPGRQLKTLFCHRCKTFRVLEDFADTHRLKRTGKYCFCIECTQHGNYVKDGERCFASCKRCNVIIAAKHGFWMCNGKKVCPSCWYVYREHLPNQGRRWNFCCNVPGHHTNHNPAWKPQYWGCERKEAHLEWVTRSIKDKYDSVSKSACEEATAFFRRDDGGESA